MNATKTLFLVLLLIFGVGLGCQKDPLSSAKSGKIFTVAVKADDGNTDITERAIKITESKLNAISLDGKVSRDPEAADRILVKIYEAEDWEKAKKFLFTSYQLELKEIVSPVNPAPLRAFPVQADAEKAAADGQEVLAFSDKGENSFVIVRKTAIVTGEDIRDAQAVAYAGTDDYYISFSLRPEGALKFSDWTGKNVGAYLGVVLDKKVISAPFIKSQIFDSGQIQGRFTKEEADDIALSLKSGYLPAVLTILKEEAF